MDAIHVSIDPIGPSAVMVNFRVAGTIAALKIPDQGLGRPTDRLWERTCFELFSRCTYHDDAYEELNLSPSSDWACYEFAGYRSGMSSIDTLVPEIALVRTADELRLTARAALAEGRGPWRLALCAVIEQANGAKSYWALRHPLGPPDFHHADCFALELASPVVP